MVEEDRKVSEFKDGSIEIILIRRTEIKKTAQLNEVSGTCTVPERGETRTDQKKYLK